MFISNEDLKHRKTIKKKLREEQGLINRSVEHRNTNPIFPLKMDEAIYPVEYSSDDIDCVSQRNLQTIPRVALEAERYHLSNTAVAAICSATQCDFGIVNERHMSDIIINCSSCKAATTKLNGC